MHHKFHKDFNDHHEMYEKRKLATGEASSRNEEENSGHIRYAKMVNHKTSMLLQRLHRHASAISDDDRIAIEQDISKYRELEQVVVAQIHRMDADHHMMRHMRDKEDRDVHLQHMKERRMSQHQEDIVARNAARELFNSIESRLDALVGDGDGHGEL
eukprot:gene22824-31121_t